MIRLSDLSFPLDYTENDLHAAVSRLLRINPAEIRRVTLVRRAVDARRRDHVHFTLTVDVETAREESAVLTHAACKKATAVKRFSYVPPAQSAPFAHRPVIVGAGPAGLFAARILSAAGARPLLLERGRDVDSRSADIARFLATGQLDPTSNVQFGEGGAGTFSDGKLNTGIKDTRTRFVLEEFVRCGAPEEILWQAKPHIGTDRLRQTVKGLREQIERDGGEIRFGCRVRQLVIQNGHLTALLVDGPKGEEEIPAAQVILAIGHSARDTVAALYAQGIRMEQKPFAVGVRIEHPRVWIDRAQYGAAAGHPALGAADYKLVTHLPSGRGVYTFCMCPGGTVIAAASEEGGLVVNGMSEFARDAVNSNSALLVGVTPADFPDDYPLSGITLQRQMERAAFTLGGGQYRAPVQLVGDFLHGRASSRAGEVIPSYRPGVTWCDLTDCLPPFVSTSLREAIPQFGHRLRRFDDHDAVLTGVESRSSSPVRILRDGNGEASLSGVYPCGEGAGYAGGITSAAVDGIRCAECVLAHPR